MDSQEQSRLVMIKTALRLINYVKDNNITVIKSDDWFIIYLLCDSQSELKEFIISEDTVKKQDLLNSLIKEPVLRQNHIRQLLSIVNDAILFNLEEFSHITKEYLNTLTIL